MTHRLPRAGADVRVTVQILSHKCKLDVAGTGCTIRFGVSIAGYGKSTARLQWRRHCGGYEIKLDEVSSGGDRGIMTASALAANDAICRKILSELALLLPHGLPVAKERTEQFRHNRMENLCRQARLLGAQILDAEMLGAFISEVNGSFQGASGRSERPSDK